MTYRGRVEHGVVVLDRPSDIAEGTEVEVVPVAQAALGTDVLTGATPGVLGAIADLAIDVDLPSDFSVQHAHYTKGFLRK